jgi:DNA-binding NtrC family response regulator
MLDRLGYHVVTKSSSLEALELFQTGPEKFDLVITDMTMPNMTGDKLAQEMLFIRPDLPVILCTGYSHQITEEKAKSIGIKEFVFKPIAIDDLAITIRKVLDMAE